MSEGGKYRQYGKVGSIISKIVLILIPVLSISFALHLEYYIGKAFTQQQYFGVFLALFLTAAFLLIPPTKAATRRKLPWYDALLIALGVIVWMYPALYYKSLIYELGMLPTYRVLMGAVAVLLVLEATRRVLGLPILILAILFILYAKFSDIIPGMLGGNSYGWPRIFSFLYLDESAILGIALQMGVGVVLPFIIFGQALFQTGGGKFLTDLALAALGRFRGGPAKVAVLASSLFGTISGSASANVATIGVVTIPMMKNIGYKAHVAGAIEAVSGTGGQIMPPVMGAAAFLIAQFLGIPYAQVALAAAVPAILYYVVVFVQIHIEAVKSGMTGLPREQLPPLKKTLARGWVFFIPVAILVYLLFVLFYGPAVVALYSTVAVAVVSMFRKETRLSWKSIPQILEGSGRTTLDLGIVCAAAGIIIGIVGLTGVGFAFSSLLISASHGNLFLLLLLSAIANTILGMGIPVTAAYILVIVLTGPALIEAGALPMAAHLFVFYFAVLSFLTPPVCVAVYVAAAIARSEVMKTAFEACKLGIVAFIVPFIFIYSPALILKGSLTEILLVVPSAIVGFTFLAFALQGYLFTRMNVFNRVLLFLGSVLLIVPTGTVGLGISDLLGSLIGLGIVAFAAILEWRRGKARAGAPVAP